MSNIHFVEAMSNIHFVEAFEMRQVKYKETEKKAPERPEI